MVKKCWFGSAGVFLGINVNATQTVNHYDNTGRYTGQDKLHIKINEDAHNSINPACFGIRADVGYQFDRSSSVKFFFQNAFTNFVKQPIPSDYRVTRLNYGIAYTYEFPLKYKRRVIVYKPGSH